MEHYDPDNTEQHFFAATVFGWGVGESPMEAVEKALMYAPKPSSLKKGLSKEEVEKAYHGGIFHVPVAINEPYQISYYAPEVEGTTKIYEGSLKVVHKGT